MGVFSIARKFSSSSKPATLLRNISARFCISRCNAESLELHRLLDRVLNHFCRLGCASARVRNLDISSTFPPRKRQKERKEPKLDKVPVVYRSEQTKLNRTSQIRTIPTSQPPTNCSTPVLSTRLSKAWPNPCLDSADCDPIA